MTRLKSERGAALLEAAIMIPMLLTVNGTAVSASVVTIGYPFDFVVLQPFARLVAPGTSVGGPLTMTAQALMRNETGY